MSDVGIKDYSKLDIIIRPCQSGKTWEMLNSIKESVGDGIIHFIFCRNNLLETDQLSKRINQECKDKYRAFTNLTLGSMIMIMCTNQCRQEDVDWILNIIDKKVHIWIDEADKSLPSFSRYIEEWKDNINVEKITFITATPGKILKKYKNIPVHKSILNMGQYNSLKDCSWRLIRADTKCKTVVGYVDTVFKKIKKRHSIEKRTIWLIPANYQTRTHGDMVELLVEKYDFSVLVINGKYWRLFTNGQKYDIKDECKGLQISEWLPKIYEKYNLDKTRFAITGNKCIERGVTIQSKNFILTNIIIPPHFETNSDNLYQMIARGSGNIKTHMEKEIKIYCTHKTRSISLKMEREAMKYVTIKN